MALAPASATTGTDLTGPLVRLANSAIAPLRSGIIGPEDLFPRGLGQDGVGIDPGAAAIQNTYADAILRETYLVGNDGPDGDAIVDIPASGSSGKRTDYVILRIEDDNFAGEASNPLSCRFARVSSLGSKQYPYIPICKIVQPKSNTAGIQDSMVTDLRGVAMPVEETHQHRYQFHHGDTGMKLTATSQDGEYFPNDGSFGLDIPEWATQAVIDATWVSVSNEGDNAWGRIWVEFGPKTGPHNRQKSTERIDFNFPASDTARHNFIVGDTVRIPKALRGTNQRFGFHGQIKGGTSVAMAGASSVMMTVTFQLRPDSALSD